MMTCREVRAEKVVSAFIFCSGGYKLLSLIFICEFSWSHSHLIETVGIMGVDYLYGTPHT